MKLIVPYVGRADPGGLRFARLADAAGVESSLVRMDVETDDPLGSLRREAARVGDSIALDASVIEQWLRTDELLGSFASFLQTRFQFVFVYHLSSGDACNALTRELSRGQLQSVKALRVPLPRYTITPADPAICGAFSGLEFGPVNITNDKVMVMTDGEGIEPLITIEGEPLFAKLKVESSNVFLLSGENIADIERNVADVDIADYFSQLVPVVMFLRYAFGNECWRPATPKGTLILDDPPLWKRYGFLRYDDLLAIMDKYDFSASIAFIPYYYRRFHPAVISLLRKRTDRFSLCFHGNDHTAGEFAQADSNVLNEMIHTAASRMEDFSQKTNIVCHKVMVFPQGRFSRQAMSALKHQNFHASVNSGHSPSGEKVPLTIGDMIQPALMKYGGFPLFLRRYPRNVGTEDIAFDAFFGKPILVVEHPGVFKNPSNLLEVMSKINAVVPSMQWSNLVEATSGSYLCKTDRDGTHRIRAFVKSGAIANTTTEVCRYTIEWPNNHYLAVEAVMLNGVAQSSLKSSEEPLEVTFQLEPGGVQIFDVIYKSDPGSPARGPSLLGAVKVHMRRTLSELRDNYLVMNTVSLSIARFIYGLFQQSRLFRPRRAERRRV